MRHKTKMELMVDPEEMFPRVEKMIYAQAWKFSKVYPITFEEAKAEAYYGFMRACCKYDADRGAKFSSFCYFTVWTTLQDLIMNRSKDRHDFHGLLSNDETDMIPIKHDSGSIPTVPTVAAEFKEFAADLMQGLSEDAQEILSLLLETPADILGETRVMPREVFNRIKSYLVASGKDACKIQSASLELKQCFKRAWA